MESKELMVKEIKDIHTSIVARSESETVDTGADIAQIVMIIEKYLKDGLQLSDLVAILELQGIVTEVLRDAQMALAGVVDALASSTVQMAIDISNEVKRRGEPGKITNFVLGFYFVAATSYRASDQILAIGDAQKDSILSYIKGDLVVPSDTSELAIK